MIIAQEVHPLSFRFLHVPPVWIDGKGFCSVNSCYWACFLAQHGLFDDSLTLIRTQDRLGGGAASGAQQFALNKFKQHNIPIKPEWIMNRGDILHTILWEFLSNPTEPQNSIRSFVDSICANQSSDHMEFVTLCGAFDRLFTCGTREAMLKNLPEGARISDHTPGNELYGRALKRVIQDFRKHRSTLTLTVSGMLSGEVLPNGGYTQTIALISDSMFGFASYVEGGAIFVRGGATCGRLTELLLSNHVHLTDFDTVILCVGTNDNANLDYEEQHHSLAKLIVPQTCRESEVTTGHY